MTDEIFVPTAPEGKALVSETTTTAPLVVALETLLAAGDHDQSEAVACHVQALHNAAVLAKPETLSDALACLLALHSEVFDFTGYNSLCEKLPTEQQQALEGLEQRWTRAIRNVAGALVKAGATTPPAFGEFFAIPETRSKH